MPVIYQYYLTFVLRFYIINKKIFKPNFQKLNIIKQIRERSLFTCIPETDTIQDILNHLYPAIFTSKNNAKYFLTIIGDNILKKNQQLIFLVSPQMKKILTELDNIAFGSIGTSNATNNFMTQYHENHSYEN
jgi:uncharacterized membrane protein